MNSKFYLQHHGILGQKWGVRRFQNSDGSLTAEGRQRYGSKELYEKSKANSVYNKFSYGSEVKIKNVPEINDAGESLKRKSDEVTRNYQQYEKAVVNNIKNLKNDREVIDKVLDELRDDFSSFDTIDDEELFELVMDDYMYDIVLAKALKNSSKEHSAFIDSVNSYRNSIATLSNEIVGEYGDMPVSKISKNATYRDAVDNTLRELGNSHWVRYLANHDDMAYYDGEGSEALDEVYKVIKEEFKKGS